MSSFVNSRAQSRKKTRRKIYDIQRETSPLRSSQEDGGEYPISHRGSSDEGVRASKNMRKSDNLEKASIISVSPDKTPTNNIDTYSFFGSPIY